MGVNCTGHQVAAHFVDCAYDTKQEHTCVHSSCRVVSQVRPQHELLRKLRSWAGVRTLGSSNPDVTPSLPLPSLNAPGIGPVCALWAALIEAVNRRPVGVDESLAVGRDRPAQLLVPCAPAAQHCQPLKRGLGPQCPSLTSALRYSQNPPFLFYPTDFNPVSLARRVALACTRRLHPAATRMRHAP